MITLSSHVLNGEVGGGLGGVPVSVGDESGAIVATGVTGEDGRIAALASGLVPGVYRIEWQVAGSVVRTVSATVELGEDRHYHLAVVASGATAVVYLGA